MRKILTGAALALAMIAAPAQAQNSDNLAGTWAFQTQPYGGEQIVISMSGSAIMTAAGANRYNVRLIAHEMAVNTATRESQMLTARQTCRAEVQDAQVSLTCEMAEPLDGYRPDRFVLQRGERDQLVGAITIGQGSATVTFDRIR